jgi:hypothetical protein
MPERKRAKEAEDRLPGLEKKVHESTVKGRHAEGEMKDLQFKLKYARPCSPVDYPFCVYLC